MYSGNSIKNFSHLSMYAGMQIRLGICCQILSLVDGRYQSALATSAATSKNPSLPAGPAVSAKTALLADSRSFRA